jgi:hypothetical protein
VAVNLFAALRLLNDADYARAFTSDQLPALVRLLLSGSDIYYVGLLFWALAGTIGGFLWFKSNYIPRLLAVSGIIASAWCGACTLVYYIVPDFSKLVNLWWFDMPLVIFEMVLSFWMLIKGLRLTETAPPNKVQS